MIELETANAPAAPVAEEIATPASCAPSQEVHPILMNDFVLMRY
jgi:hypothetical protein